MTLTGSQKYFNYTESKLGDKNVPPLIADIKAYDDGTILVHIIRNETKQTDECSKIHGMNLEQKLRIRIISINGTVKEIDPKLKLDPINYCLLNGDKYKINKPNNIITYLNDTKNNNFSILHNLVNPITIYPLQKPFILITYVNTTNSSDPTSYKECGEVIDWDGNSRSNMCFNSDDSGAWINSTTRLNANKKLGFIRIAQSAYPNGSIYWIWRQYSISNITTYYIQIYISSSGISKRPLIIHLSQQGLSAKITPVGGYILGVTAYDNNDNNTHYYIYAYDDINNTLTLPESFLTNSRDNTFLLASPYKNDNITWSLLTIPLPMPKHTYDQGYDIVIIDKTIPSINAKIDSSIIFLKIRFFPYIALSKSKSNITIYKTSDNSIRQRVSATMHDFCIISPDKHAISIKIINSAFNEYDEQYFVTMDDNFVQTIKLNAPIKGIHDGIWTLRTYMPNNQKSYSDNVIMGSVRFTQEASEKFKELETNKSAYIDNLLKELADKVPINRSCIKSDNRYRSLNNKIAILIRIDTRNIETKKRTASEISSDLNTMIIYKNITAFSLGITNVLDQNYGFQPIRSVWNDNKVQIMTIIGIIIFIIFCLLYPILIHKMKSKKLKILSSAILKLGLIIPNFILSILFVVYDSNNVPELFWPSMLILSVPLFINIFIATYTIYIGIKNPFIGANFKEWVMKYRGLVIILTVLAAIDYKYLSILKDIPIFTKKLYHYERINIFNILEHIFGVAIIWGAIFDIFFRNIPQIIIQCTKCKQPFISPTWCQLCDPQKAIKGWTSENKIIDEYIKEFQIKVTDYEKMIEWVPFHRLINLEIIREEESGIIFMATWLDGIRIIKGEFLEYKRSRIKSCGVNLKCFQTCDLFMKELKNYMQSEGNVVYGITKNTETDQYIIIMPDEFNSRRNYLNGICNLCGHYNTSPSWCQSCDPWKTIQWTSGNEVIDSIIKELQFKATKYETVIEWIPFERLSELQKIREKESETIFMATWLDGIRTTKGEPVECTQSRIESCGVNLKILHDFQTCDLFIKELKNYMQLEENVVYGITQNEEANQYIIVIPDEFSSRRNDSNGICEHCAHYNTSPAWCQSCDPWKATQEWTSGNEEINNFIKEFQFNANEYENVIEWIQFDKLINLQEIKGESDIVFMATWVKEFLKNFKNRIQSKKYRIHGMTQNTENGQFMLVIDFYNDKRKPINGMCEHCKRYNTNPAWCQLCDLPKVVQETSGDKNIDECIKEFQLKATTFETVIEWIPYNRLDNIKVIGRGGFGTVYSSIWLDGKRMVEGDNNLGYVRYRNKSCEVALKTLPGSQTNSSEFLNEFKNHMQCRFEGSALEVYGLTQNKDGQYMMVYQYANRRNLNDFLTKNFRELVWQKKLKQLADISYDLSRIHKAGLIPYDFHSDEHFSKKGSVYGVMPYVAPEILKGQQHTQEADIYGLGIIMTEITTGKRPYDGSKHDFELALKICNGLRPKFAEGTPDCYIELAKQCMDSNPQNRPTAEYVHLKINQWKTILESENLTDKEELDIKKKFIDADSIIKQTLLMLLSSSQDKYCSTLIDVQGIVERLKGINRTEITLRFLYIYCINIKY
ncbi:hypothetical protein C2G38_2200047 [Gigaspora rosea]|uniref:Protein kinase domain-containing protein n=1 Tax=Gigaspora rosea TaxID=44941 RepID=A0A397UTZ5_9GLOM|nr:hypothetical protein C2G38_2200047 [Gigaspora rosea]